MTQAQAKTQQLGALLDLRNWIYTQAIICCPAMTKEIERRITLLRAEIRALAHREQIGSEPKQRRG